MKTYSDKRLSLEITRIIALILVLFNHTGENGFELFRCAESKWIWEMSIFIDLICKAGVPLFFMVSGVLLLDRNERIIDILRKRILRYLIIIVFFSFIYYVILYISHPEYGFSLGYFVKYIYSNPFIVPYWFLYSYVEFLILLPVLRAIIKGLDESGYLFLAIVGIFACYVIVIEQILGLEHINISIVIINNTIFYPIIGYGVANKFSKKLFSLKMLLVAICLLIVNYICALYLNKVEYISVGECSGKYIDAFALVPSIIIFYLLIYFTEKRNSQHIWKNERVICYIGGCTFVTYLFEDMLRSKVFIHLFAITSNQLLGLVLCIPYIAGIMISGCIAAAIIRKIPVINKLKL